MDIVKEKEFIELTAADRAELGELCSSEDEYNQIKSMFVGMSAMDWSNPTPKAETKASLDDLFAQTHPKAAPVWYNAPLAVLVPKGKPFYRQPLVQVAAVGLLVLLAYPFVNSTALEAKSNQVAALEKEMTASEAEKDEVEVNSESPKEEEVDEQVVPKVQRQDALEGKMKETVISAPAPSPAPVPLTTSATVTRDISGVDFSVALSGTMDEVEPIRGRASETTIAFSQPGSTHPDGVFVGGLPELLSVPASENPAVFDLLTATF